MVRCFIVAPELVGNLFGSGAPDLAERILDIIEWVGLLLVERLFATPILLQVLWGLSRLSFPLVPSSSEFTLKVMIIL